MVADYNFEREYSRDVTVANYGSTTIAQNLGVLLDTTNILTSDKPSGVVLPTAGGGVAGTYGIAVEDLLPLRPDGTVRPGRVAVAGAARIFADGPITAGEYVQVSDTLGREGWAKVAAAGIQQLGQAKSTAADGELVLVEIDKARNA